MVKKIQSRKKNFKQLTDALPQFKDDKEIQEVADELDNAQLIAIFSESEAGRLIVDDKIRDANSLITELLEAYKKPVLNDLISIISRLHAHLNFIASIKGARKNEEDLQELIDAMIKKRQ